MRVFQLKKLVRDGIVPDMEAQGQRVVYRKLSDQEYPLELDRKAAEEESEFSYTEPGSKKELADQLTVMIARCSLLGITLEDLIQLEAERTAERGGFETRTYVETVTLQDGDTYIDYYLGDPERFPEVTE